jgi:Putative zinc-finger
MTQACAMWRGDIGAYIVGALDAEASARVRRHLRACRACRGDYHDLVPVRDWLGWPVLAGEADTGDRPGRPPLEPIRPLRGHGRGRRGRRWLPAAVAAAAGSAAVAVAALPAHPAAPAFRAFDRATGVHGLARLTGRPNGTEIDLTVSGLPADVRCTLVALSPAGREVAGTWSARYDGTARVEGTAAIPVRQLTALRIETSARRLLLAIPV